MERSEYLGQAIMRGIVMPARAAYLVAAGSADGFRRAAEEASTRWGGITEPIVLVPEDGQLTAWDQQVIDLLQVEAAVNIDVPIDAARTVAASLDLELVELQNIDRYGSAKYTCHTSVIQPLSSITNPMAGAVPFRMATGNAPICAMPDAPLWHVAAAGVQTDEQIALWRASPVSIRPSQTSDEFGRVQAIGGTLIHATGQQFGAYRLYNSPGESPTVIWVTDPDDAMDCAAFWNLRALGTTGMGDPPVLLLPSDEIQYWHRFKEQLAGGMLRRAAEFSPDVLLRSHNVSPEQLGEIAATLGLELTDAEVRSGHKFPSEMRSAPFTYRLDIDPRPWFVARRDYGAPTSFEMHLFRDKTAVRFPSPVDFNGSGWALTRFEGAAFNGLPRRPEIAKLVHRDAEWRGDSIQLRTHALPRYGFDIAVPSLREVVERLLQAKTQSHAISSKGKIGASLQEEVDIAALLDPDLYGVVLSLTTPRSKQFARELKALVANGSVDKQIAELAQSYGRGAQRVFRSSEQLGGTGQKSPAILDAAERLCDLGWAERGLKTECTRCGTATFVPLRQAADQGRCPGCSGVATYVRGANAVTVYYRLNTFIDQASDQGILPHLRIIAALTRDSLDFSFLPGVDLWFAGGADGKPRQQEADIFGVLDGKVVSGEIKTSWSQYPGEQVERDVELSQRLGVDIHVMGAMDATDEAFRATAQQLCDKASIELIAFGADDFRP